jgi:hypothetical protein
VHSRGDHHVDNLKPYKKTEGNDEKNSGDNGLNPYRRRADARRPNTIPTSTALKTRIFSVKVNKTMIAFK